MAYGYWGSFPRYVSAGEKRARAAEAVARLTRRRKGPPPSPVVVTGRKIASTFWGQAWCDNLESYADFAYRLDRGRSYVRHGAVVDLQIEATRVRSSVAGTRLYAVEVTIRPLERSRWKALVAGCGDRIDSVVSLLDGRLPDAVLRLVTHRERGLFPAPRQIAMTCTCPDWAGMCKHVAATLYGVGARLDQRPDLLFLLRGVDHNDLVHAAAARLATAAPAAASGDAGVTEGGDLGALFGIELTASAPPAAARRGALDARAKGEAARAKTARARAAKTRDAGRNAGRAVRKPRKTSKPRRRRNR
jgi:uncharacterized Zn finger protein